MLVCGCLVGVAQEQAGNGEAAVALTLFNAGLLQQVQGATTGTEEDELRVDGQRLFLVDAVDSVNGPGTVGLAVQVGDLVAVANLNTLGLQVVNHLLGEGAEVNVGTFGGPGCGDRLVTLAAVDGQRCPLANLLALGGELHALEELLLAEGIVACSQVLGVVFTEDQGHVGDRVDEVCVAQDLLFNQGCPELAGNLELLVNVQRLSCRDGAVGASGGVVEFAQCRVAGTCVVPGVGGFLSGLIEAFEQDDVPARFEFLEEHTEGGAHDAAADQDDVGSFSTCYH